MVLGSAGRGESLLAADQDHSIVYAEGQADGPEDQWFAALGEVARPGGVETLFDGSFGATGGGGTGTAGPSHEEPDGRARGA